MFSLIGFYLARTIGLDLPRSVKLGRNVQFIHDGVGTVVHPLTIIEDEVTIYNNVTIGRADVYKEPSSDFEGFVIKKGAVICAGARVLCSHGKLIVGENAVVGANCVLLHSVPPGAIVVGIPGVVKKFREY